MNLLDKIPITILESYATVIQKIEEGNVKLDSVRGDIHSDIASRVLYQIRGDKRKQIEEQLQLELDKFIHDTEQVKHK